MSLQFKHLNEKYFIIYGDKKIYQKTINSIGGRWSFKNNGWTLLKDFLHKLKEIGAEQLDLVTDEINEDEILPPSSSINIEQSVPVIKEDVYNIHYNRYKDDSDEDEKYESDKDELKEDNDCYEDENENEEIVEYKPIKPLIKLIESESNEIEKSPPTPPSHPPPPPPVNKESIKLKYANSRENYFTKNKEFYNSFNKNPKEFQKHYLLNDDTTDTDSVYSSSTYTSSESDYFPTPPTYNTRKRK